MKRYKIVHRTCYSFTGSVQLGVHTLRLRPREDHELRIESSVLNIHPAASLRWHRDVEGNSVTEATFSSPASQLVIESEILIQQFNQSPLDFLVADYATNFPFNYSAEDIVLLSPYLKSAQNYDTEPLLIWLSTLWHPGENIQTYGLLQRLNQKIKNSFRYQRREEPGVQNPSETLALKSGSCRDTANLFMEAARLLGLAARFVSGYVYSSEISNTAGSTHAWVEVFIPGAGWKGFDPTSGNIVGADHIAVAVARLPESVPPVSGSFIGSGGASLEVGVWVSKTE